MRETRIRAGIKEQRLFPAASPSGCPKILPVVIFPQRPIETCQLPQLHLAQVVLILGSLNALLQNIPDLEETKGLRGFCLPSLSTNCLTSLLNSTGDRQSWDLFPEQDRAAIRSLPWGGRQLCIPGQERCSPAKQLCHPTFCCSPPNLKGDASRTYRRVSQSFLASVRQSSQII